MSGQALQAGATFTLTAMLVLITAYYAWQNRRMVEVIRRQNRPYLYIDHEGDGLVVKNGGTRSAHDIRIHLLSDAKVPKQYETFVEARITKAGDPAPPRGPAQELTHEEWAELTQGTVNVSTLPLVKGGIPTLAPAGERMLATVVRHVGRHEHQRFDYEIEYRDGSGLQYFERQVAEYDI